MATNFVLSKMSTDKVHEANETSQTLYADHTRAPALALPGIESIYYEKWPDCVFHWMRRGGTHDDYPLELFNNLIVEPELRKTLQLAKKLKRDIYRFHNRDIPKAWRTELVEAWKEVMVAPFLVRGDRFKQWIKYHEFIGCVESAWAVIDKDKVKQKRGRFWEEVVAKLQKCWDENEACVQKIWLVT